MKEEPIPKKASYAIEALEALTRDFPRGVKEPDDLPPSIEEAVIAILQELPELQKIEKYKTQQISGGGSFQYRTVARSMIERIIDGVPIAQVATDMFDFIAAKKLDQFLLAGIAGIELDSRFEIRPGVEIITPDDISPSWAKEYVFRVNKSGRLEGRGHEPVWPKAALKISHLQPGLVPPKSDLKKFGLLKTSVWKKILDDIIPCLTISSPDAAPGIAGVTSWIDHPAQSYSGIISSSGGKSPNYLQTNRWGGWDKHLFQKLFRQIECLSNNDKVSVFLAIERLRRSRLHETFVDRAIELGMALELMLQHGIGSKQELRYRAATNAAFYLGHNPDERHLIYKIVLSGYDARSKAVHNGKVDNKECEKLLPKVDEICRRIAIRIIDSGGFPERWENVVLGKH